MKLSLRVLHLNNNHTLKIISFIFGYFFWLILVQTQKINSIVEIPIGFYGLKENLEVIAPENIKITLSGKRIDLANITPYQMAAAHIDATQFNNPGDYKVALTENEIFLNNKIKLVDFSPESVSIKINEKKV